VSARRLAVRFSRGEDAKGLGHREVLDVWEKALSSVDLSIAAVEGRSRRPRFALAAPLPTGFTSSAEWVEIYLHGKVGQTEALGAIGACLPAAFAAIECHWMEKGSPSLQSQLKWAEYRIVWRSGVSGPDIGAAIDAFFERESMAWEEMIEGKTKRFDLLALVDDLWAEACSEGATLGMRLDASTNGTGRPDSVLAGLGLAEPDTKFRSRMIFSYMPDAVRLWRRGGRFEDTGRQR
jgi:radical SAM-linked protein